MTKEADTNITKLDAQDKSKRELPEILKNKGDVASFGGSTLAENMKSADLAIADMNWTERIWDRSRSQWSLKHIVHSFPSHWKNLRQISAEMQRKRDALREAKYNYSKKLADSEIKKAEIESKKYEISQLNDESSESYNPHKAKVIKAEIKKLEIEVAEIEDGAECGIPKIEGALKEIHTLKSMYDQLTQKIAEETGCGIDELSEEDFEKYEARSHIKYAVDQAIREVRMTGVIKTGVQQYLEQCGINVTHILKDIRNYLQHEESFETGTTQEKYEFLEIIANKYENAAKEQVKIMGFDEDPVKEITYSRQRDDR